MRRLGAELGVDPTAVYRHFRDKDELLQAAADWLLAGVFDDWEASGDWAADLRTFVLHARRRYLEHPGLLVLVASASGPLQSEASATDRVIGMLRSGGLGVEDAARGFEVLQDYLISLTVLDAGPQAQTQESWRGPFAALAPREYPHLAEAAPLLYEDLDARFEYGLDLLVDSLDRRRRTA
jgi:AcrR family transcriptional regulator